MAYWRLAVETFERWFEDGGPQWSAAIAYYAVLSLAPFLILVSAIVAAAFGDSSVTALNDQLGLVLGQRGVEVAMSIIESTSLPSHNVVAWVGNVVVLLVGATIVFANAQGALNRIWGIEWVRGGRVRGVLRQRALAFAMIAITGLIMLALVGLTTIGQLMSSQIEQTIGGPLWLAALDTLVSILILAVLFAASFRILPDGDVAWRDVALGASVTACLFVVGKIAVSAYLARAAVVGAYGVAGSLVFFLIWVYYSAAIFFLGAEFTQVWADSQGRPIVPDRGAARLRRTDR